MSNQTYLKVCAAVTVAWVLGLLFLPPFAQTVEQVLLLFLSTTAR